MCQLTIKPIVSDLDDKTPGKFRFRKPNISKSADEHAVSAFSLQSSSKRRSPAESHDVARKSARVSHLDTGDAKTEKDTSGSKAVPANQRQLLSFGDDDEEDG